MSLATSSANEIALLQQSSTFAMSLGAKELFHTNFLAFLLESDDPALDSMRHAIRRGMGFTPSPGATSRCVVWRERRNLDLVIVELTPRGKPAQGGESDEEDVQGNLDHSSSGWDWSEDEGWCEAAYRTTESVVRTGLALYPTGKVLVVEAKLKSLPRLEQLEQYDQELSKHAMVLSYPDNDSGSPDWRLSVGGQHLGVSRCLLSLGGQSLTTSLHPWQGVAWSTLHAEMDASLSSLSGNVLEHTLTDYVRSLGALIAMVSRTHRLRRQARHPASVLYGAVLRQPLDPQFRQLRVADLLGKTLYDGWLDDIRRALSASWSTTLPSGWRLGDYVHYSNGMPGLGVEFIRTWNPPTGAANELHIGVQLQGRELRLFVSVERAWSGLEQWAANHPVLWPDWFPTPIAGGIPGGARSKALSLLGGGRRYTNLKVFDADKFIYSGRSVTDETLATVESEIVRIMGHCGRLLPRL